MQVNAVDRMKECDIVGTLLRYNLGDDYDGHGCNVNNDGDDDDDDDDGDSYKANQ